MNCALLINCKHDLSTPNDDFYNDCNVSPLKDFRAAIGLKPTSSNKKKEHLKAVYLYIYIIIYCFLFEWRSKQLPLLTCFSFSSLDRNNVPQELNSDSFPKERTEHRRCSVQNTNSCSPWQWGEHLRERSAAPKHLNSAGERGNLVKLLTLAWRCFAWCQPETCLALSQAVSVPTWNKDNKNRNFLPSARASLAALAASTIP